MILLWILLTLLLASGTAITAKRFGSSVIIGMYAAMAVIANILAGAKIVTFLGFAVDAGTIVYGALFLLTDMLSEFWGKKEAQKAVIAGFLANIMLILSVQAAMHWTAAPFWNNQEAFISIFGMTWRIVIASLCAYLVSQTLDIKIYGYLKKITRGKYLFLRNNASTWTSQLIDTLIFTSIAFIGMYPLAPMIIGMYLAKIIIAAIDTPFLYAARWYYRRNQPADRTEDFSRKL